MIRINLSIRRVLFGLSLAACFLSSQITPAAEPDAASTSVPEEKGRDEKNPPADPAKKSSTNRLREIRDSSASILEELVEKHGYRLDENQVIARVVPPFPELRATYYKVGHPGQAKAIQRPPNAMTFFWDGKRLKGWGMTFGEPYNLVGILDSALKIKKQDIEGPEDVINKPIPGDWVIRPEASEEQVLKELEAILQRQLELPVRLAFAKRVRTVYVARGKYQFTAVDLEDAETDQKTQKKSKSDRIEIYGEKLGPTDLGGGGAGDLKELLGWVGRWIEVPLIDEVEERPSEDVVWHLNDMQDKRGNPLDNRNPELVLKNLTAQTGLTFKKEYRAIRRLIVEPIE
ncbi:hypothetical protein [Schlesneria paludicola]|uniref:hypothetical protein n=1 Tax=Schlesneria paludicola TaxID=360056 RepID=UPI00029AB623|nr:hypothetical protein [Schlesneria paludicola]